MTTRYDKTKPHRKQDTILFFFSYELNSKQHCGDEGNKIKRRGVMRQTNGLSVSGQRRQQ